MALTDIKLANLAILQVGGEQVTALTDRDNDWNLTELFEQVREEIYELFPWNFVTKRKRITVAGLLDNSASVIGFVDGNPDTITDDLSSFVTNHFKEGERATVVGSGSNNGVFDVSSVVAET